MLEYCHCYWVIWLVINHAYDLSLNNKLNHIFPTTNQIDDPFTNGDGISMVIYS